MYSLLLPIYLLIDFMITFKIIHIPTIYTEYLLNNMLYRKRVCQKMFNKWLFLSLNV